MEGLRDKMLAKGASAVQISSKTMEMVEEILAEDAGVITPTVANYMKNLEKKADKITQNMTETNFKIQRMQMNISNMEKDVTAVNDSVKDFVKGNKNKVVEDKRLKDAILAYHQILAITIDSFGADKMTEGVMVKAIEAGSYAFWRSVMGGKYPNDDSNDMFTIPTRRR